MLLIMKSTHYRFIMCCALTIKIWGYFLNSDITKLILKEVVMRNHQFTAVIVGLIVSLGAAQSAMAQGYSMCQFPGDNRPSLVCGRGCPRGSSTIAYNPGNHARCNKPTESLPEGCTKRANLADLGWSSGHKTKFCQRRGYDGVTNTTGGGNDYHKNGGGWCYSGDVKACTPQ